MWNTDIKTRVLLVALAPVALTALAMAAYFSLLRYEDAELALQKRGLAAATHFANAAEHGLSSGDLAEISRLAQSLLAEPEILVVTVYDTEGKTVFSTRDSSMHPGSLGGASAQARTFPRNSVSYHHPVFASTQNGAVGSGLPIATRPDSHIGNVTVEFSREHIDAKESEIFAVAFVSIIAIFVISGAFALRLGKSIVDPIAAMEAAAARIRQGVFSTRVMPNSCGALRNLVENINEMAAALENANYRNAIALHNSESMLERQSHFANALLEAQASAGLCMIIVDDGRISFANSAAVAFIGRTESQLFDLPRASSVIFKDDQFAFEAQYRRVVEGSPFSARVEVRVETMKSGFRWAEVVFFEVQRGKSRSVAVLGVDISQRKVDAERLLRIHRELRRQKDAAERASEAKSRFIAAASHDLRQPLHALSLLSDRMQEIVIGPDESYLAQKIREAAGHMSDLLESLLDISILDLSALKPEIRPVDAGALLIEVLNSNLEAALSKGLRLTVVPTSIHVLSDRRYLVRMVTNLVSNAIRYTDRGGVVVGARRAGSEVRIEVWDTGIGIHNEQMPMIFQEFYQVHNPERDSRNGLGLGLAIVDRLALALGHRIMVRSQPQKGSVFCICLSRASAEDGARATTAARPNTTCVMIASNYAGRLRELITLVENWGYAVRPADSVSAMTTLTNNSVDVIVADDTCVAAIGVALKQRGLVEKPIIYLVKESGVAVKAIEGNECLTLEMPVRPAKLRALLLHAIHQEVTV